MADETPTTNTNTAPTGEEAAAPVAAAPADAGGNAAEAGPAKEATAEGEAKKPKGDRKNGRRREERDNVLLVSRNRQIGFYKRKLRKILQNHKSIVLQGLGKAMVPTVELSQHLVHNMNCEITKIRTSIVSGGMKKKKIMIEVVPKGPLPGAEEKDETKE
mmetsp:Transcript_25144/g.60482  ORF Transcript_25144/g.60482 Transcript_25144/m.60482 type:complete len:160 (+) Transcript_25144:40-519(+)